MRVGQIIRRQISACLDESFGVARDATIKPLRIENRSGHDKDVANVVRFGFARPIVAPAHALKMIGTFNGIANVASLIAVPFPFDYVVEREQINQARRTPVASVSGKSGHGYTSPLATNSVSTRWALAWDSATMSAKRRDGWPAWPATVGSNVPNGMRLPLRSAERVAATRCMKPASHAKLRRCRQHGPTAR